MMSRTAEPKGATETRYYACLSFSTPLVGTGLTPGGRREPPTLISYTREVGPDDMELLVPSLPFLYRYLLGPDFTLRFELTLPDGSAVSVEGVPTYDKPLNESDTDIGYMVTGDEVEIEAIPRQYIRHDRDDVEMERLIGVRIKNMSPEDRTRYQQFLRALEAERPLLIGQIIILPDEEDYAPATTHHYKVA